MAEVVRMPKLSDTMEEGVVAEWHKKVGDTVESGDLLAEIETDKATMEFESFQDGVLLHIGVDKGSAAPVDGILAILGEKGEDIASILSAESAPAEKVEVAESSIPELSKAPEANVSEPVQSAPAAKSPVSNNTGRVIASPLAKKLAADKGIEISSVQGSGDGGRLIHLKKTVYI